MITLDRNIIWENDSTYMDQSSFSESYHHCILIQVTIQSNNKPRKERKKRRDLIPKGGLIAYYWLNLKKHEQYWRNAQGDRAHPTGLDLLGCSIIIGRDRYRQLLQIVRIGSV
ncbi:hypothetical protein TNIN_454971 [Trichonephila inaurata madagascariensis]|uniref:Uncharacterized protein n=1 Tax=Trichonephila inaurata madagascariensis TaxID=2747483 RepID=A0A8X6YXK7_9ARAC|nr:hypothetical protein TNIN_454971 [Trichonephila inaurata madagascariensis]